MAKTTITVPVDVSSPGIEVGWDEVIRRDETDPADLMLRRENDAMIQNALKSLPASYRTAVELCDIEGLSCERISEIMFCPIETVQSRLQQGHVLMKKAFEEIENREPKPH